MMFGDLGRVDAATPEAVLDHVLHDHDVLQAWGMTGDEVFVHRSTQSYKSVVQTFRYDQIHNGLRVDGGEIAVHITPSTLRIHGISGNVILNATNPVWAKPITQSVYNMLELVHNHIGLEVVVDPELVYTFDEHDQPRLAFKIVIHSNKGSPFFGRDYGASREPFYVMIDAMTHRLIMDVPMHHKFLNRKVYDDEQTTKLPGKLIRSEGGDEATDFVANQAYSNAGNCYYYYYNVFQRDSWNNEGAPLNSTVHYNVAFNNAFWNGQQMVYGDGDGKMFADFANDLSVICHELSHAVTQSTSNLRYWSESGALNEGFSDIMGSSAVIYTNDPVSDTPDPSKSWVVGPNCTLVNLNPTGCPNCPAGIRYMDNPTLDGQSSDYYPERYAGFQDNRGVHLNSGIANLAYVLTVQGGDHPRKKTNIHVDAIGIKSAQQIYYTGFTHYLISTSTFADAHTATVQAAKALGYSKSVQDSVSNAWLAVGVQ